MLNQPAINVIFWFLGAYYQTCYYSSMHVRFSSCIGLPIMEEGVEGAIGTVSGILIHPDTAAIEGFFVYVHGAPSGDPYLVSSMDILRWGTRVYVRSADVIAPASDRIRLQSLLEDNRTVLDQKIVSETGMQLGRCKDVQFNTETMHVEWIFPRKFFRWGVALPIAEVIEIRLDAIIIKDLLKSEKIQEVNRVITSAMPELSEI